MTSAREQARAAVLNQHTCWRSLDDQWCGCCDADELSADADAASDVWEPVVLKLQAAVRFCYPDDMTPSAKRMFDSIFEEAFGE